MKSLRMPFPGLGYDEPVELVPLHRVRLDSPRDARAFVAAVAAAGEPALQTGGAILVRPQLAGAWALRTRRYSKPPIRGAKMRKLIEASAARAAGCDAATIELERTSEKTSTRSVDLLSTLAPATASEHRALLEITLDQHLSVDASRRFRRGVLTCQWAGQSVAARLVE